MKHFWNYKKEILRLDRLFLDLNFLRTCKRKHIVPNFIRNKNHIALCLFPGLNRAFEIKLLNAYIRYKSYEIRCQRQLVNQTYYECCTNLEQSVFKSLRYSLNIERKKLRYIKLSKQLKKIDNLCSQQHKLVIPPRQEVEFINLSKRTLNPDEERILHLGPKFVLHSQPNMKDFITDIEYGIFSSKCQNKTEIRQLCQYELTRSWKTSNLSFTDKHTSKVLKNLRQDKDIIIIETDKTNKLALLDTEMYKEKMNNCIREMKCVELKRDPMKSANRSVQELILHGSWPSSIKVKLKNKNGVTPPIFGKLKDHKINLPLRPIVQKCIAPTYVLEKAFVNFLREYLPASPSCIHSTQEAVERIKEFNLPEDFILVSFDVVSLYPSIDARQAVNTLIEEISKNPEISREMLITIKSALFLIVDSNYFKFDGKIFKQSHGAPMGSPLSGIFAEVLLRPIDIEILKPDSKILKPLEYIRYVDDSLSIWTHHPDQLPAFIDFINKLNKNIQFTFELEKESKLPFLDLLLIRHKFKIKLNVYRKPAAVQTTMQNTRATTSAYTLAAFRSFITRAFRVCEPEFLEDELQTIRNIAKSNGFPEYRINRLIQKFQTPTIPKKNFINAARMVVPYKYGFFERLKNKLKKFDIQLIAKAPRKLKNILATKLDPREKDTLTGVYMIPYITEDDEKQFYVGMTDKLFYLRLNRHKGNIHRLETETALSRLNIREDIDIDFNNAKIIFPSNNRIKSLIRESLEIFLNQKIICNDTVSWKIPYIWKETLNRFEIAGEYF